MPEQAEQDVTGTGQCPTRNLYIMSGCTFVVESASRQTLKSVSLIHEVLSRQPRDKGNLKCFQEAASCVTCQTNNFNCLWQLPTQVYD